MNWEFDAWWERGGKRSVTGVKAHAARAFVVLATDMSAGVGQLWTLRNAVGYRMFIDRDLVESEF